MFILELPFTIIERIIENMPERVVTGIMNKIYKP